DLFRAELGYAAIPPAFRPVDAVESGLADESGPVETELQVVTGLEVFGVALVIDRVAVLIDLERTVLVQPGGNAEQALALAGPRIGSTAVVGHAVVEIDGIDEEVRPLAHAARGVDDEQYVGRD